MTKSQAALLGVLLVLGVSALLVLQWQARSKIREKDDQLLQIREQLTQLAVENERLSNQLAQASSSAAQGQSRETLRLRGEVVTLKKQLADSSAASKRRAQSAQVLPEPAPQERLKELGIAKLNFTKEWMLAFMEYANQHGGQLPSKFEDAQSYLPQETVNQSILAPEQFEIVYQGAFADITNPASIIVIREKEAMQVGDGGWVRGYGFADGHSEIHAAADGNFQNWEAQHMIGSPPHTENLPQSAGQ